MIKIIVDNEELDIDEKSIVTFKKSQQLNGIQNQYSFSNNINLPKTSKNQRLLKINYLPNSKAKSMTVGYACDVILNGCIFLKNQTLKVQKETETSIPSYLVFTDSFFVAKAKQVLMNEVSFGVYPKTLLQFFDYNSPSRNEIRTAPISAQNESGLVVVEEVPALYNLKSAVSKIITKLGYNFEGDFFEDPLVAEYWFNPNLGVFAEDSLFDKNLNTYQFLQNVLKTFNAYIEVSDSSKNIGVYLWKNIERIKSNFVDYSDKYVKFEDYIFEGGLAKKNTLEYTDSADFYNGYFENNKSIVDQANYLKSDFGAGSMRLFDDLEIQEDGRVPLRDIGFTGEPTAINLYRFENTTSLVSVYYLGTKNIIGLFKAFSPNILEIYNRFHSEYTKNISLPTVSNFTFRYDAIFLANFKMQEIYFIKQLSTYWLPLELNFTTEKDKVTVKSLMIEKNRVDAPIVFDQSLRVDFYGEVFILDIFALYFSQNTSPASQMVIQNYDRTKNKLFINGTEIISFPTAIDVSQVFQLRVENIEPTNTISNSDILFQFISQAGGVSRIAKINVAHSGRASYVSEFRSNLDEEFFYGKDDTNGILVYSNFCDKIGTPINIPDTLVPDKGSFEVGGVPNNFRMIQLQKAQYVKVTFNLGYAKYKCSNRGGKAEARTKVFYEIYKNGILVDTAHSNAAIDSSKTFAVEVVEENINTVKYISANAGDYITAAIKISLSEENRPGSGTMDGSVTIKNISWKFECSE